ncbi:MAG: MinD/ParA family protein [Clostridiales bacterium]|nr:MinD/ParA family protein [Clostridiales bacterium]
MEVNSIKKIITAIGNPMINNELKKEQELNVINNDIQYQDGIFEILEIKKEIDFLILNELIPGDLNLEDLIDKIYENNYDIKIIIILENYNEKIERKLIKKGVYRIFYNNKVNIDDIKKLLLKNNMEIYNEEIRKEIDNLKNYIIKKNKINYKNKFKEKIKKYININLKNMVKININNNYNSYLDNSKIISILGNNGAGKSVFSVMLANKIKRLNKKVLIIDFDILNNSLHTILGVKKYPEKIKKIIEKNNEFDGELNIENLIIKINNKIDLISGINILFNSKIKTNIDKFKNIINYLKNIYDYIIIDTTSECFFEYTQEIINISNKSIFLTEANLLELSKSKRLLEIYKNNWNIDTNKINIIFNKYNKNSIDMKLLQELYSEYNILGNIKFASNYNFLINNNMKYLKINNKKIVENKI